MRKHRTTDEGHCRRRQGDLLIFYFWLFAPDPKRFTIIIDKIYKLYHWKIFDYIRSI